MAFLGALWLPIALSAVFVFIASCISHMVIQFHKNDYKGMDNEDKVLDALRDGNNGVGHYSFPYCPDMKEMNSDAMKAKMEKGPVGFLTIMPSFAWGKAMMIWFIYLLIISIFVAYLSFASLQPGTEYLTVFRFTGTLGVLVYGLSPMSDSIWRGIPWANTIRHMIDGIIYGLVTAGTFAWLWPGA